MDRIATAGQTTRDWLDSYYRHVDAMRVDELLEYFAPDAKLSFANYPPALGRDGIRAALGGVLGAIAGIRHDIKTRWEAYVKGLQWGVYSPNEIRALDDMNPRDGGDIYYPPPNTAGATPNQDQNNDPSQTA